MALCPFANKKWLIEPGANDPRIEPRIAILHTDGGDNYNLGPYFDGPSGGIESHFHIAKNGDLFQYRDTDWEADANYLANPFAISIETQGTGYEEWTPEQIATAIRLLRWLNMAHPEIALAKCPTWDGSGIGYHIQFGSPGKWTNTSKICPGPKRIEQFTKVLIPALAEGDDVSAADIWNHKIKVIGQDKEIAAQHMLQQAHNRAGVARQGAEAALAAAVAAHEQAKRNRDALEALASQLDALAPGLAAAVISALGESIEVKVTVDVTVPEEENPA